MRERRSLLIMSAAVLVGIGLRGARSSASDNVTTFKLETIPLPVDAQQFVVRRVEPDGTLDGGLKLADGYEPAAAWDPNHQVFILMLLDDGFMYGEVWGGNSQGDKVGYESVVPEGAVPQAILWSPLAGGQFKRTILDPSVPAQHRNSIAYAISEKGTIVGSHLIGGTVTACLFRRDGKIQDFPMKPGTLYSDAQAIDKYDYVAGTMLDASAKPQVWFSTDSEVNNIDPLKPYTGCELGGMNLDGQIAGTYVTGYGPGTGPHNAFTLDIATGKRQLLSTPRGFDSQAFGINGIGDVVGVVQNQKKPPSPPVPVVWDHSGALLDLQKLIDPQTGITLGYPRGIDDAGRVIISGTDAAGKEFLVRLTLVP